MDQIAKYIGLMSELEGDHMFFVSNPAEMIYESLLGQILCVGHVTVLNENVTVSKTFNDQGKHFFCLYCDVDLRVHFDTLLDENKEDIDHQKRPRLTSLQLVSYVVNGPHYLRAIYL